MIQKLCNYVALITTKPDGISVLHIVAIRRMLKIWEYVIQEEWSAFVTFPLVNVAPRPEGLPEPHRLTAAELWTMKNRPPWP